MRHRARTHRVSLFALIPASLLILGPVAAHAQPDAGDDLSPPPSPEVDPLTRAERTLLDRSAPVDARAEAARILLAHEPFSGEILLGDLPAVRDHPLARILLDPGDPEGRESVLRAIGGLMPPPRLLWPVVAQATAEDPLPAPEVAVQAIAAFGTGDAAIHLFRMCDPARSRDVRRAASRTVAEMVAESFKSPDDAWAWYQQRRDWPRLQWTDLLRRVREVRLHEALARAESAERRLVGIARRLWVRTPEEERTPMLDEFLGSSIEPLRALAIELIREQIASGRPIAESTISIVLDQLDSPRTRVRADAAILVAQAAPQSAGARVLRALQRETDAGVAEQLLMAITRWPSPEAVEPTLRWLGGGGRVSLAAAEAAAVLQREGLLAEGGHRERLLAALRDLEDDAVNGGACRLLVELGDAQDRSRVIGFLASERASLRLAAAQALVSSPEAVEALLEAAHRDQNLAPSAVRAVLLHRRDASGIQDLRELEGVAGDVAVAAQREILAELDLEPALRLAQANREDACRFADDLQVIISAEQARRVAPQEEAPETLPANGTEPQDRDTDESQEPARAGDDPPAEADLLEHARVDLASALLACGRPESALQALDGLTGDLAPIAPLRARALIRLGNLEEALQQSSDASLWLDELQRAEGQEREAVLASFILDRMGNTLSEEQLAAVRGGGVPTSESEQPDGGEPTDTAKNEDAGGDRGDQESAATSPPD